jgi:post-segregation antitoxin (ccd killing protein)
MDRQLFDLSAPKDVTTVSINSDLLRQVDALNINLAQTLEKRLAELLMDEKRRHWREESRAAIDVYYRRTLNGVFSDGLRRF